MDVRLLIGDVAELLGISTKTIRHYHKLGLLAEPERTEAGYRLYSTQDLLLLHRIRRLQRLGLSLQQIKAILDRAEPDGALPEILRALLAEIDAQIQELAARRERIEGLLDGDASGLLDQTQEVPPTLRLLQEHLAGQVDFDPAAWEQDRRLFAQLDTLLWADAEYQNQQAELVRHMAAHPEAYRQIATLTAQIAALAKASPDAPEVEKLAAEMAHLRTHNQVLAEMVAFTERFNGSASEVLGEILTGNPAGNLSPAQRRLFQLAVQRFTRFT